VGGRMADGLSTERLVRLSPCFLCYRPFAGAPPVAPRPTFNHRHPTSDIVFVSFNSLAKLSPPTIALWSRILQAVPGSRLLLKGKSLADPAVSARFLARFAASGIPARRLDLLSHTPSTAEHLAAYGRADIALDPFPYNGTTTTLEALWMGLPVVTLAGTHHASRVGLSLLTTAGLPDLITASEDDYLRIATALAHDAPRRAHLRQTLRPQLAASPLCNTAAFVPAYEQTLRSLWRAWCASPT
jgi:protein O-GlcNAc transferase